MIGCSCWRRLQKAFDVGAAWSGFFLIRPRTVPLPSHPAGPPTDQSLFIYCPPGLASLCSLASSLCVLPLGDVTLQKADLWLQKVYSVVKVNKEHSCDSQDEKNVKTSKSGSSSKSECIRQMYGPFRIYHQKR
ncbi:hypothetical protein AOLI_G00020010 [Acnodon oligacanthus]